MGSSMFTEGFAGTSEEVLGEAYKVVREVYDHISEISDVADVVEERDLAIRTELAASTGGTLIKVNSRRNVNQVLGDGPWLGDVGVGALTDQQAFEYACTNEIPVLRVPPRSISNTDTLTPIAPIQLQGFGGGRVGAEITVNHNGPFMQTLVYTPGNGPVTVSMDGLNFKGNLVYAACGVGDFYDNGNGMISNILVEDCRGTVFRNKFGVALTYDNIRFSLPAGAVALELDGTGDFQNGSVLRSLYSTGGTIPFRFTSSGGIVMIGCQADGYTTYGMSGTGGGAHMIGCFFESAGQNPGLLTDFDLTFDDQTRWTHGDWVLAWGGVAGSQRMQMIGKPMFGSGSRLTAYAPAAADTWYPVPLTADEPIYHVIHYAGGTAAQERNLTFERPGVVEIGYEAFPAAAATPGTARAQLFHFAAGVDQSVFANATPIVGTGSSVVLGANSNGRLASSRLLMVEAGEAVVFGYGASDTSITLAISPNGAGNGPNLSSPPVARLWAKSTRAVS